MALDVSSVRKSLAALERSIDVTERHAAWPGDIAIQETLKAGVIHGFKVAYELCWKFMKRWLEDNIGAHAADGVSRRELFRLSAENLLIGDVDVWMDFHGSRNLTSHTYNAGQAEEAYEIARRFLPVGKAFLIALEVRNG